MTKRVFYLLSIFLAFVITAPMVTAQSDEESIKKLITNYVKAMNMGDANGVVDLFMPDGVFMPHGSPAQVGDKAIHAFYQDTLFGQESLDINFEPVEVVVLNGWAFARVEATGTTESKDSGTSAKIDNKALFVLSRTSAGTWKIARLMWNRNSGQ